jgi:hypothetical protein
LELRTTNNGVEFASDIFVKKAYEFKIDQKICYVLADICLCKNYARYIFFKILSSIFFLYFVFLLNKNHGNMNLPVGYTYQKVYHVLEYMNAYFSTS